MGTESIIDCQKLLDNQFAELQDKRTETETQAAQFIAQKDANSTLAADIAQADERVTEATVEQESYLSAANEACIKHEEAQAECENIK